MSTNQAKADPYESQLKRGGRGGGAAAAAGATAVYRPSSKSGGGPGPSTGGAPAHPSSTVRPNGRRKQWHSAANGEPLLQPRQPQYQPQHHPQQHQPHHHVQQQPQQPQQQQGPGNAAASRRPVVQNNGSVVKPVAPSPPEPDTLRGATSPPVFQFGSYSPAGVSQNVGMQIPARTASAPPNLDEQKREQAQFEASLAAKHLPVLPHGPVLGDPTGGQHHMTPVVRPVHMPVPVQVVATQPQQQMQPVHPQHGMVQPAYAQGAKFQPPSGMAAQVTTPMVGPPIMGHPQYSYLQPRVSKAIKIVNPKTQEEVRLDTKMADSRPPLSGAQQQPRPVNYAGNFQGATLSTAGAPFFPQGESPRFSHGPSARGVQAVSTAVAAEVPTPAPEIPARAEDSAKVETDGTGFETAAVKDKGSAEEKSVESVKEIPVEDVKAGERTTEAIEECLKSAGEPASDSDETSGAQPTGDTGVPESSNLEDLHEAPAATAVDEAPAASVVDETAEEPPASSFSSVGVDTEVKASEPSAATSKPEAADQNGQQVISQAPEVVLEVKQGNKKKNKKKLLAKADAAGSTADLYNAYKAPDEKTVKTEPEPVEHQAVDTKTESRAPVEEEEEEEDSKEVEDWEDAADLPTPSSRNDQDATTRRYTRDFLLTCRDHHLRLPADFEVRPDMDIILIQQTGQQTGRRSGDDDRWSKATPGRAQDIRVDVTGLRPGGMSPGMRFPSPMLPNLPPHVLPRAADGLTWIHPSRGLFPLPHTPHPAMHKAEKPYAIGIISDEEEQKQRQVKSILNKLTPQNFEKLFAQVQDLGIKTAATLQGVIAQIFDKAIMEPTFCETYARFCVQLSLALPEFTETGEKVTFKRVLLNKCQEEFERGKREEEEAGKIEEDGVSFTPEEREVKRVKARRRMLGNIRFIGELYKNSMLTERIMHQCIKTLLGEYQDPDEEDVEALCKLMTTIGQLIDHNKAKAHMDAYFDRIQSLSNNQKLPSRLRFGLKDVIDLRRNDWQQRRKVEGPKKIEEVHRDAHQERLASSRDSRDRYGRNMSSRRTPVGGMSSPMPRGRFPQDPRKEDPFLMESARPMAMPVQQRPEEFALVPQGGLGRGPLRGAAGPSRDGLPKLQMDHLKRPGSAPSDRGPPYTSRDDFPSRGFGGTEKPLLDRPMTAAPGYRALERSSSERLAVYSTVADRPSTPPTPATPAPVQTPQAPPSLTEEQLKKKSNLAIEEYYSARDVKEVVRCVEELARSDFHAAMVCNWISESFERKELERDLLAKLIKELRSTEPAVLTDEQLREGFASFLSGFEDVLMDVPKAADYLGSMMGKMVAFKLLPLPLVSRLVREGGQEKDSLLQSKDGLNIFGSVLETIRKETSEAEMLELYRASGVSIHDFVLTPKAGEVEEFLRRRNLQCLDPIFPVEVYIKDALEKNVAAPEIFKWLETNAASLFTNAGFQRLLMTEILNHTVLPLPADELEVALKGKTRLYSGLLKKICTVNPRAAAATQRQYIAAVQLFAHGLGHPSGLMTVLFNNFYDDEVIPEIAFQKWEDDVRDTTPGRQQAIREVGKWLKWLAEAPEEEEEEDED